MAERSSEVEEKYPELYGILLAADEAIDLVGGIAKHLMFYCAFSLLLIICLDSILWCTEIEIDSCWLWLGRFLGIFAGCNLGNRLIVWQERRAYAQYRSAILKRMHEAGVSTEWVLTKIERDFALADVAKYLKLDRSTPST